MASINQVESPEEGGDEQSGAGRPKRRHRQRGYGRPKRRHRQRGYGRRRRRRRGGKRRRRQRGRGARWDRFKAGVRKVWGGLRPSLGAAAKKTLPMVSHLLRAKKGSRKKVAKAMGSKFAREAARNLTKQYL